MKYIVTSDIHLGHRNTPTEHVIKSFKETILNDKNKDIDVLFIAGDLFDRLLDLNTEKLHCIIDFFNYMLDYCHRNNILLRDLEGTPSHEWKQSELLYKLNDIRENKVDLRYHKLLEIEYIERIGKYVLYIPDEWPYTHEEIESQIAQKMATLNISKIDIAILHGQFLYQIAVPNYKGFFYKEKYFLNLVRGYIHIGHYHTYTTYDRIIANGSLERLTHGEEEDKGCVLVDNDRYTFLVNKNSYIYKTINVTQATTLDSLDKSINKLPKNSYIRLNMSKDHPFNLTFNEIKLRYLDYNVKKKLKLTSEQQSAAYILSDSDIDMSGGFDIDNDIYKVLKTSILSKHHLSPEELVRLDIYLEPYKDASETSTD